MARLGLERSVVDAEVLKRTAGRFRQTGVVLPTVAQLKNPATIPAAIQEKLRAVEPDASDPLNMFRVHWFNDANRKGLADIPAFVELPEQLTGVKARIVVLLGDRFPMIRAHKVLAAYACLAPRIVTGQFDPTRHRAIWPSTGNYCRGGIAISRIMGCRGVAILPAGMSRSASTGSSSGSPTRPTSSARRHGEQRQGDLRRLQRARRGSGQLHPQPVLRVRQPPRPLRGHRPRARPRVRAVSRDGRAELRLAAFVSATGSAGTIAAGDRLKEQYGTQDRRRRGARVPDDAGERLRRAQHPGHRRQAHPADPQRDEHRRGGRRSATAPPTSSTCCSTPPRAASTSPSARRSAPT